MKGRPSKKTLILDAAAQVVEEQGAAHLTIDAVAATADVSKGGVLYHFPNKQALLAGMLEQLLESIRERLASSTSPHGGVHRHVVALTQAFTRREERAVVALLAAAAEEPELLHTARAFMREVIDELKTGPNFIEALLLLIAVEGQRVMDAIGILPLEDDERADLAAHLLSRAEEAAR